jgi:hypothetical protein
MIVKSSMQPSAVLAIPIKPHSCQRVFQFSPSVLSKVGTLLSLDGPLPIIR